MSRLVALVIGLLLVVGAPPVSADSLLDMPRPPRKKVVTVVSNPASSSAAIETEAQPGSLALARYAQARNGNFNTYGRSSGYSYYNSYSYSYPWYGSYGYGYPFGGSYYWGQSTFFGGPFRSFTFFHSTSHHTHSD